MGTHKWIYNLVKPVGGSDTGKGSLREFCCVYDERWWVGVDRVKKLGTAKKREREREWLTERERENNSKPDTAMAGSCALYNLFLMTI